MKLFTKLLLIWLSLILLGVLMSRIHSIASHRRDSEFLATIREDLSIIHQEIQRMKEASKPTPMSVADINVTLNLEDDDYLILPPEEVRNWRILVRYVGEDPAGLGMLVTVDGFITQKPDRMLDPKGRSSESKTQR